MVSRTTLPVSLCQMQNCLVNLWLDLQAVSSGEYISVADDAASTIE